MNLAFFLKVRSPFKILTSILLVFSVFACQSEKQPAQNRNDITNETAETDNRNAILFFGDSITAGLGVDLEQAFPFLIQAKIDSLGANYRVINGGNSGETSSGGLRRIDWMLRDTVDVFIYELGANDGLRGIDLDITRSNSETILQTVIGKYPNVKLLVAGGMLPPNLGSDYTTEFAEIYPALAEKFDAQLIPFILENVAGISELNQSDGIHPTPEGHKIISNTVWTYLAPLLDY